jgi:hypothetical protein
VVSIGYTASMRRELGFVLSLVGCAVGCGASQGNSDVPARTDPNPSVTPARARCKKHWTEVP